MAPSFIAKRIALDVMRQIEKRKHPLNLPKTIEADLIPKVRVRENKIQKKIIPKSAAMQKPAENILQVIRPANAIRASQKNLLKNAPRHFTTAKTGLFRKPADARPTERVPLDIPEPKYGKITPLIVDPSVTSIECAGPEKEVIVYRGPLKQITNIRLSKDEINSILEKFSDMAHVPLLEGIFRVIVDNIAISAVVSSTVGSKFAIKKIPKR